MHNRSSLESDKLINLYLKYAHPAICVAFEMLFNKIFEYGVVSLRFCEGVITPVVENLSKSLLDVGNYRPVSIISIVAKLFEMKVSARFGDLFTSHDNQFGFSINADCNKTIFAVNNSVTYFLLSALDFRPTKWQAIVSYSDQLANYCTN